MNTPIPQKMRFSGFTLVEMAIVIMIASVMLSAGLSLLTVKMNAARFEATQKHQEAIKQALINYLGQYKRLPCPADPTITGKEVRTASPCLSYSGIVPYYELGLDRGVALDGWENFITYVVSPNPITTALPITTPPTPPWTTAWLYTYSTAPPNTSQYTANGATAFWPSTSTGGITVAQTVDPSASSTLPLIADPANTTGAAVVLISYGKNGFGAINFKGVKNLPPPPVDLDEIKNISPVTTASPWSAIVVKRDTTDSTTAVGGSFDDIVMILSANDLTGPLIASGTLQSSAQAALSQANDIVMGNIVASKTSCSTYPTPALTVCKNGTGYFYTIPSGALSFPPSVTAWGLGVTPSALYLDINYTIPTPVGSATAYTITSGDGAQKTVLTSE